MLGYEINYFSNIKFYYILKKPPSVSLRNNHQEVEIMHYYCINFEFISIIFLLCVNYILPNYSPLKTEIASTKKHPKNINKSDILKITFLKKEKLK